MLHVYEHGLPKEQNRKSLNGCNIKTKREQEMDSLRSGEKVRVSLKPFMAVSLELSVGQRGEETEVLPVENATESSWQTSQPKQVS